MIARSMVAASAQSSCCNRPTASVRLGSRDTERVESAKLDSEWKQRQTDIAQHTIYPSVPLHSSLDRLLFVRAFDSSLIGETCDYGM